MRAFSKKILDDIKLDFKDVLIKPKSSKILSRQNVNLERSFRFKYYTKELNCIPIMASNMATIGTPQMAKTLAENKCLTVLHKFISDNDISELDTNYSIISTGINKQDIERATYIIQNSNIDKICIDIANGYLSNMITTIKYFRTMFPDILIIAGNIVTPHRSLELIAAGADIIKVGIGSGACCLTRLKTGIGYPQLSAVIECYEHIHSEHGHIVSDGGISSAADVCKAFGGGASFVMIGSMFGGHDECGGEIVEVNGKKKMLIYGMSSDTAQTIHNGGMNKYRTSEGRSFYIDYKGSVQNTLDDILGGLRSYGTYIGCNNIENFENNTQFIKVNRQLNNPYDN